MHGQSNIGLNYQSGQNGRMSEQIDTTFDFHVDTPKGKDPDAFSPKLRRYHRLLWSKPLPSGRMFNLVEGGPKAYLYHGSHLGEYNLASDAITHTYRHTKAMSAIIQQIPWSEMDAFYSASSTIGAYTVFPKNKIGNKMTINQARGVNHKIKDRFDITLECIRLHYLGKGNPLSDTLIRNNDFFRLFGNFSGYVEFFLLQDLVSTDYSAVNFHLPFTGFTTPPLPRDLAEYKAYKENVLRFVAARNQRISSFTLPSS